MKRCPITYDIISEQESYSERGLKLLAPQLSKLLPLPYSAAEQRHEAAAYAGKMSLQGMQPKITAQLKVTEGQFELVDQRGRYILKPQSEQYPELPENEALTMSLAEIIGIEIPVHGLVYSKDNSKTYFIKRFDRFGHGNKLAVEDFAQLLQLSRDTKYDSSMEKVVKTIETYCSFPRIEAVKLFRLTLFNFLVGNEDMHMKNFSLITRENITSLSPAYDLINTTIAQRNTKDEIALPLNGKKNNLTKNDLLKHFPINLLKLNDASVNSVLDEFKQALPGMKTLIGNSFLSESMQEKYLALLEKRREKLGF